MEEEALRRLLSADPRGSAQVPLRLAQAHLQASSVALIELRGKEHELFVSQGFAQGDLARISRVWSTQRARLLAGETVIDDGRAAVGSETPAVTAFAPIGHPPRGVFYVGPSTLSLSADAVSEVVAQLGRLFELALTATPDVQPEALPLPAHRAYLERTPIRELEREKVLILLTRNRWNFSAVARLLEVTRPTLYKKLRRLGIHRPEDDLDPAR